MISSESLYISTYRPILDVNASTLSILIVSNTSFVEMKLTFGAAILGLIGYDWKKTNIKNCFMAHFRRLNFSWQIVLKWVSRKALLSKLSTWKLDSLLRWKQVELDIETSHVFNWLLVKYSNFDSRLAWRLHFWGGIWIIWDISDIETGFRYRTLGH